jgi:hypothetical protein
MIGSRKVEIKKVLFLIRVKYSLRMIRPILFIA